MTHRPALVPAILALCAAGTAAALDHEQAFSPLVLDAAPGTTAEYFVGVEGALKSKVMDDHRVLHDDTALGLDGRFRAYGFGLGIDTDWAVAPAADDSRPGTKTSPGEMLRVGLRLDYAIEIRDPRDTNIPLLQIIPKLTFITYPNQRDVYTPAYRNWLKDRQRWLGVDVWWAMPVEGVELGAGFEQNLSTEWRAFRAGIGAREFIQYNAVDMAFWQKITMGDAEYREAIGGEDKSGFNALVIGGRGTVPMFVQDVFAFVEVEASYWLDGDIRDNFKAAGRDGGDVVLSVGLNWMPKE